MYLSVAIERKKKTVRSISQQLIESIVFITDLGLCVIDYQQQQKRINKMTVRASFCKQKEIMTFKMTKTEFYDFSADVSNNDESWVANLMIELGEDRIKKALAEARGRTEARQMEISNV